MATARGTWKTAERRIANFFNTTRTPLSGGNGKQTRSDTLHPGIFVEAKLRVKHAAVSLWRETKTLATKENKIPVICLSEKHKPGFWVMCHSDDFVRVAKMIQLHGYLCQNCATKRGALPTKTVCTVHKDVCPDCGQEAPLSPVDEWLWPKGSKNPVIREEEEE